MKKLFLLFLCTPFLLAASPLQQKHIQVIGVAGVVPAAGEWFGSYDTDYASNVTTNYTAMDTTETAPSTGQITQIKVYTTDAITGAKFDCYYVDSSNRGGRGGTGAINLSSGENTLNAPGDFTAFSCTAGDFPGIYVPAGGGRIAREASGGSGVYYKSGDLTGSEAVSGWSNGSYEDDKLAIDFYVE
jgi:hypothetical protein